jgi:hypothetical protein
MPTYITVSDAEAHARRFPAAKNAWDGPGLYNKETGYQMDRPQGDEVCAPMVMRDIQGFVARAHYDLPQRWKPKEITSRSHLRRYEIDNSLRQAGDFKPGEIIGDVSKKREREAAKADRLAKDTGLRGPRKDFEWT